MRHVLFFALSLALSAPCVAQRAPQAAALLRRMQAAAERGTMIGHHDDTVYGIGWEGDSARSDIRSVCGDYPAIISFDLGELELGQDHNLDRVGTAAIRRAAQEQHRRGGIVSLSWHPRNIATGGDAWDVSDTTVVAQVLPGGKRHKAFLLRLDNIADFILSLRDAAGQPLPIIFRPWHEHTGSWFWWGQRLCSATDYRALWRMTYDHLTARGCHALLWAYSTGIEPQDTAQYLERYPGDDIVDIVGYDAYKLQGLDYYDVMARMLRISHDVAAAHGKLAAVCETGYEGVPDPLFWTGTLLPLITRTPPAYLLLWRNAREKPGHYYAPYPGHTSAPDFVRFYHAPQTIFAGDMPSTPHSSLLTPH